MRWIRDWILESAAHGDVIRETQRIVVRTFDRLDVVAEVTVDPLQMLGQLGEVQAVGRCFFPNCQRRMAIDAKIPQRAVCLFLTTAVHGEEYWIQRSIRVHASRPFGVVFGVAFLAGLGIEKFRSRAIRWFLLIAGAAARACKK